MCFTGFLPLIFVELKLKCACMELGEKLRESAMNQCCQRTSSALCFNSLCTFETCLEVRFALYCITLHEWSQSCLDVVSLLVLMSFHCYTHSVNLNVRWKLTFHKSSTSPVRGFSLPEGGYRRLRPSSYDFPEH